MQIKKKITITYVVLSGFSTLLLCFLVFFLFRQNNQYYFIKRLEDRAKIVASVHYQNDSIKATYYRELRANGLEELIDEKEFILKLGRDNTVEPNAELKLQEDFYRSVINNGAAWTEEDDRYYYGLLFNEQNQKYIAIISAKDRRGYTSILYITRILIIGGTGFIFLAYFLGRFFARRIINPISGITKEANRITASNLHNRLPYTDTADEISDLAKTFNNMLDRLETSFEIQANFINNASHELKTPITTIIAETEIALLKERETAEYESTLNSINKQATRLANLTESLLKLTQTGYDGTKQVQDIARMDDLLLDVKSDLDRLYPDNRINIKLDDIPEDDLQLMLPCNRPLLELAIGNIISNGIKYSDNNEVYVTLTAGRKVIKITIADIGIGIPEEDIPYLYEPFFRGKKASKYIGYGLGLPLAAKIIRMHSGEITIQSEPDKGTTVNILFRKGKN